MKTFTQLAWYLERKWKYSWWTCCSPRSFHYSHFYCNGRTTTAAVTKLVSLIVLVLFLWLVYISVWAATIDISSGEPSALRFLDNNNELSAAPSSSYSGAGATGSAVLQQQLHQPQSTESEAIPFKTVISYETSALPRGTNANGTFITLSLPQFTRLERIFYR